MKKISVLIIFMFFGFALKAGIIQGFRASVSPKKTYHYRANIEGYNYSWYITEGIIHGISNSPSVFVQWNDNNKKHKISVTVTTKDGKLIANQSIDVDVLSLKDVKPEKFTDFNNIVFAGDKTPKTFQIPTIRFPQNTNFYASQYEWSIPVGWIYNGKISEGDFSFLTKEPKITVTPNDCNDGKVRVRGIAEKNTVKSLIREKFISRELTGIFANRTTVCGKPKKIKLSIIKNPDSQAVYQWSKPLTWKWMSETYSNEVFVMPNGETDGTISIMINGCNKYKKECKINLIPWDTKEKKPEIRGNRNLCIEGGDYFIHNIYSNTVEIKWSVRPSNFFSGLTEGEGTKVHLKPKNTFAKGNARLTFFLKNQCGHIYPVNYDFRIGPPEDLIGIIGNQEYSEDLNFCKTKFYNTENVVRIKCSGQEISSDYQWDIISNNFAYKKMGDKLAIQPYKEGFIVFRAKVKNSCGWSEWEEFTYPVLDCKNGEFEDIREEKMALSLRQDIEISCSDLNMDKTEKESKNTLNNSQNLFMVLYPNPANQNTTLRFYNEDEIPKYQKNNLGMTIIPVNNKFDEYKVQIWHEKKGLIKQIKSRNKQLQISTHNLKESTYFLNIIINGRVYKKQLKVQR